MFGELFQLDLCHGHERVDFMLGALEILDAKCVDGNDLDAGLVAHFKNL